MTLHVILIALNPSTLKEYSTKFNSTIEIRFNSRKMRCKLVEKILEFFIKNMMFLK